MSAREGNAYLEFPAGADLDFPEDKIERRVIVLGEDTTNTCNIAIADADGDGLDEIATPLTIGEDDCVRLYRGDGTLVWQNDAVRLYHGFYNDPSCPDGGMSHMWHKRKHRHVLTEIVDFDDDGALEVVVGDGPIYVLDALSGAVKTVLDLGGRVALWNVVYDGARGTHILVACADDQGRGPRVVGMTAAGDELWTLPTPGKAFCDCMHHGDLDLDGRPETGFSVQETGEFWIVDCDGNLLWKKHVPTELGDDPHVDDFLIDRVSPEGLVDGNQVLLVTGPNLLDKNGAVLWCRGNDLHHAQKVLAANLHDELPGKEVYTVESYRRRAHLLDSSGDTLWEYDNFTRARPAYASDHPEIGQAIGRLTTAGDLIDWSGNGKTEIAQAEILIEPGPHKRRKDVPPEALKRFMHVLDKHGQAVSIFPIDHSPMCALAANVTPSPGEDIVTVGHRTSRMYIYSKKS